MKTVLCIQTQDSKTTYFLTRHNIFLTLMLNEFQIVKISVVHLNKLSLSGWVNIILKLVLLALCDYSC